MLHDYLQIYTLSIVVNGEFNPIIIQPFWLANKKLIREQEAQGAKVEIMHNEIVKYSLDWLKIEATRNRIEFKTSQEPFFEPLRDLVISLFEILSEAPVHAIGVNHLKYFALPDKDRYFEFGNRLAPLKNFNNSLNNPRMLALEILEQKRKDKINGTYRIRIQPSDIKLSTEFAVLININDNMMLEPGQSHREGNMLKIFASNWVNSRERATEAIENIWKNVNV